jgi:DNA replication protein DnaC
MSTETIRHQFKELRLYTAAAELEDVLAQEKKSVTLHWLSTLLHREIDARKERALTLRIKHAQFPELTTLESFDWDFNPDIDRSTIMELSTLGFIKRKDIALFLGKPGTGKTHLALAIGVKAIYAGMRVYCSSVKRLSAQITLAKANNSLDSLFKRILSAHLWILDDWGVVSMPSSVAEEVFDLLDRRKYSSALLLTSNRDVSEWRSVFPDPVLAGAAIDRLFDRATVVTFLGKSYRLQGKISLPNNDCLD